ncbi:MAG: hypothetical protein JWO82_3508 [Akkermansiaceae bacterium]|nr:hypothetical protein [Akkermansiaceae bacterium]
MGLMSPEAKAVLAAGNIPLAFFAELSFRSGVERYWTGTTPIRWDGQTWLGVGNLGAASAMDSSEDFRANGITLQLIGLPSNSFTDFDALTASDYKGCRARLVTAIMTPDFRSVVHPIPRFYFIDTLDYELDPELGAVISVALEVETRRASRARVRRYTPQDQEAEFPGDKAFEFVPYINSGVDVKWGTFGSFFPPS